MVLAIDIGNTNIVLGGFSGEKLAFTARISTDTRKTVDEYAVIFSSILNMRGISAEDISGAIISSVVPPLNAIIKTAVHFICGKTAIIVGPGVKTGINIKCDSPSSVGADIICSCVAVNRLYGAPAIIIDLGTATKITVLDASGSFTGVAICPGVIMGVDALAEQTAQLPRVSLEEPTSLIGKNTTDSMRSGIVYGHAAMLDGMIERITKETGTELPVYATGGMAPFVTDYCFHKITADPNLILKGLNIIFAKNN